MAALKHEVPALAVQALITEQDIATVLDRRIANYERMKLLEAKPIAQPETNQHSPTNQQNIGETPIDLHRPTQPAPLARIYDKRMWRRF